LELQYDQVVRKQTILQNGPDFYQRRWIERFYRKNPNLNRLCLHQNMILMAVDKNRPCKHTLHFYVFRFTNEKVKWKLACH